MLKYKKNKKDKKRFQIYFNKVKNWKGLRTKMIL